MTSTSLALTCDENDTDFFDCQENVGYQHLFHLEKFMDDQINVGDWVCHHIYGIGVKRLRVGCMANVEFELSEQFNISIVPWRELAALVGIHFL